MSGPPSPISHDCVSLWLLDLRRAVEMECTSILLAKPIPVHSPMVTTCQRYSPMTINGRKNSPVVINGLQNSPVVTNGHQISPIVTNGRQNSPMITRQFDLSLDGAESELILGGRIPVGVTDYDASSSRDISRRCPPLTPTGPRSLSIFVSENDEVSPPAQLNNSFLTAMSQDDSRLSYQCRDSGLELLCNGSSNASSSDESTPNKNALWSKRVSLGSQGVDDSLGKASEHLVDNCSLDSACGSSPVLSNDDHHYTNDATSSGNSNTPSGSPIAHISKRNPNFPMYPQLKESLDRLLNAASHMYATMDGLRKHTEDKIVKNVVQKVKRFFELADNAGFCAVLPFKDFVCMKSQVEDLYYGDDNTRHALTTQFISLVKSLAEKVLGFFAKIILGYLAEVRIQDTFLYSALKHLAHVSLFGEDVCLEVIQFGGVSILYRLCRQLSSTAPETLKQILRTLAVLCSVSKGCVQLLSVGGLDLISRLLNTAPFGISVEAAGVLTQLTAPCHSFAILPTSLSQVVQRLLDMCDECRDTESLLLCSAALANLTLQHTSVSEQLYKRNAVLRLCKTFLNQNKASVFVMDQLATILARLSANGYDQALIGQGAIPTLLHLVQIEDQRHPDLCKRIHHKAALCLGSLAAQSFGLKAVHDSNGRKALQNAIAITENDQNPVQMICHNLLDRISARYELESAV